MIEWARCARNKSEFVYPGICTLKFKKNLDLSLVLSQMLTFLDIWQTRSIKEKGGLKANETIRERESKRKQRTPTMPDLLYLFFKSLLSAHTKYWNTYLRESKRARSLDQASRSLTNFPSSWDVVPSFSHPEHLIKLTYRCMMPWEILLVWQWEKRKQFLYPNYNECRDFSYDCLVNATCVNSDVSYSCRCPVGYACMETTARVWAIVCCYYYCFFFLCIYFFSICRKSILDVE